MDLRTPDGLVAAAVIVASLCACTSSDIICSHVNPDDKALPNYVVSSDDASGAAESHLEYGACPATGEGYCADDFDCSVSRGERCYTAWSSCGYVYPGSCAGTITCATGTAAKPTCPAGQVPLIFTGWDGRGCYTSKFYPAGACIQTSWCTSAPTCAEINDEANCLARACEPVYTGIDCHTPDGSACQAGDISCTCQSFEFATCEAKP